ncbi:hypothetical protein [Nonomuraea sp. GTA35]
MPEMSEAELVAEQVNQHPTGPTEPDEEELLRRLYGEADSGGIYRGEPQS